MIIVKSHLRRSARHVAADSRRPVAGSVRPFPCEIVCECEADCEYRGVIGAESLGDDAATDQWRASKESSLRRMLSRRARSEKELLRDGAKKRNRVWKMGDFRYCGHSSRFTLVEYNALCFLSQVELKPTRISISREVRACLLLSIQRPARREKCSRSPKSICLIPAMERCGCVSTHPGSIRRM